MQSTNVIRIGYMAMACAAFSACTNHTSAVDPPGARADASVDAPSVRPVEPRAVDTCNGLDDNDDGVVDEGRACHAVCSKDAIAEAGASLRLPRADDRTVPEGSLETPALLAIQQVPEFCTGATPPSTRDAVTVGCGEILDVDHRGFVATTLRVAPGGIVRFTESARLDILEEILVCPGAMLQSGAGLVLDGDGRDGANIDLHAERLIMLGKIETRGGWVTASGSARPGRSGDLQVEVDRLLFAGVIDTAEPPMIGYRTGDPGYVGILATKESFFSGHVRSGNAWMKVPVCCAK